MLERPDGIALVAPLESLLQQWRQLGLCFCCWGETKELDERCGETAEALALRNEQAKRHQYPHYNDEDQHEDATHLEVALPLTQFMVVERTVERGVKLIIVAKGIVEGFEHLLVEAGLSELAGTTGILAR